LQAPRRDPEQPELNKKVVIYLKTSHLKTCEQNLWNSRSSAHVLVTTLYVCQRRRRLSSIAGGKAINKGKKRGGRACDERSHGVGRKRARGATSDQDFFAPSLSLFLRFSERTKNNPLLVGVAGFPLSAAAAASFCLLARRPSMRCGHRDATAPIIYACLGYPGAGGNKSHISIFVTVLSGYRMCRKSDEMRPLDESQEPNFSKIFTKGEIFFRISACSVSRNISGRYVLYNT
jgi:hypothetical protein